jgi:hypothetical protein
MVIMLTEHNAKIIDTPNATSGVLYFNQFKFVLFRDCLQCPQIMCQSQNIPETVFYIIVINHNFIRMLLSGL